MFYWPHVTHGYQTAQGYINQIFVSYPSFAFLEILIKMFRSVPTLPCPYYCFQGSWVTGFPHVGMEHDQCPGKP